MNFCSLILTNGRTYIVNSFQNSFIAALAVILSLLSISIPAVADDIAIIANNKFPLSAISAEDVSDLYLGKVRELTGAGVVKVVDQSASSAIKGEFAQKVLKKTLSQLNAYWSVRIFTGHGVPPLSLSDERTTKEWIANNPEGIAYVLAKNVDKSVKVLLIVH